MGFGLSFGSNKTKSSTSSVGDKTETGTQTGTSTTANTQTSNTTQNTTSSGQSTGSSQTAGSSTTTGSGTQVQQQTTQLFDSGILGNLENAVTKLLGGAGTQNQATMAGLDYLGHFDPNQFINSSLAAARAKSDSHIGEILGPIFDALGGRGNSMAALLANKVQGEADANLAGIAGQLQQTAAGIAQGAAATGAQIQQGQTDLIGALLSALKGGTQTTSGQTQTNTSESQNTASNTNTQEANTQNQQQQTDTTSTLLQVLSQILNTTNNTHATETSNTKGKTSGGGLSLSL